VQLADAVQEAARQLLFDPITTSPAGMAAWWHKAGATSGAWQRRPASARGQDDSSVEGHWLNWQTGLVTAANSLALALQELGMASAAGNSSSSSSSSISISNRYSVCTASSSTPSSSSSSSKQVKWNYLLRLQQSSPKWAAAVAATHRKWPTGFARHDGESGSDQDVDTSSSNVDTGRIKQQYYNALQLFRALVAAAPVTIGCNSLACQNLAGVIGTAAAESRCSHCKCCHYCSTACQVADWPLHKQACRNLAASNARQNSV
jgi:hypothetical protein